MNQYTDRDLTLETGPPTSSKYKGVTGPLRHRPDGLDGTHPRYCPSTPFVSDSV